MRAAKTDLEASSDEGHERDAESTLEENTDDFLVGTDGTITLWCADGVLLDGNDVAVPERDGGIIDGRWDVAAECLWEIGLPVGGRDGRANTGTNGSPEAEEGDDEGDILVRDRSLDGNLAGNDGHGATSTDEELRNDKAALLVCADVAEDSHSDDLDCQSSNLPDLVAVRVAVDQAGDDAEGAQAHGEHVVVVCARSEPMSAVQRRSARSLCMLTILGPVVEVGLHRGGRGRRRRAHHLSLYIFNLS